MKIALSMSLLVASVTAFAPQKSPSRQSKLANDLWSEPPGDGKPEMSKALPFVPRPKILDGTLPGDAGFE
jgi:hypothetical protein